jgi:hypothetical protein
VLTAPVCLALDDRPPFLTDAARLLFQQLSETSRRLLGVTGTATTERAFKAACRRVRYCFGAIGSVADPSPLPKNRRLTGQDLKARTEPMTPAQSQAARGRLEAFLNALIEASISARTGEELAACDGSAGLDATVVPLFSASTSPPARWATPRSWTTAPASPASRQTPAAPSSSREPGTAPPCPGR